MIFDALAQLNAASFVSGAPRPFLAGVPGEPPVKLRLLDVTESDVPGTEQFSLIFGGPAERALGQGLREIRHETLGAFALFLVPVGVDGPTVLYQAVFNRLAT